MKDFTADGIFALTCLLASILYSAVGDKRQAAFFFGGALLFVVKDIRHNDARQAES